MKPQKPHAPKPPAYRQATDLLARTAAIGITFFGTGPAFAATEMVRNFSRVDLFICNIVYRSTGANPRH